MNLSESYKTRIKELAGLSGKKMINVSCAALGRIVIDGKLLLFKEKKKFQPVGGGLKYYQSAIPFLESIEFETDRTDMDLRIRIPESNWIIFKKWFESGVDRETTIKREIDEELTPFLGSKYTNKMNSESYVLKEAITDKNRIFQIHYITFPKDVREAIIALVNRNEQFILATSEEIVSQAHGISDHSDNIVMGENIGTGPHDNRAVSDITADLSNKIFNSPDFADEYDPDNGVFLYDDEYDEKLTKELPNHDFDDEAEGYSNMKNRQNWKKPVKNKRF